jgi:hypothetical protein
LSDYRKITEKRHPRAGTGDIPAEQLPRVKAQLLALLLHASQAALQRLASAFGGGEEEDAGVAGGGEEPDQAPLLPGPHAPLRCLLALDTGAGTFTSIPPLLLCHAHASADGLPFMQAVCRQ